MLKQMIESSKTVKCNVKIYSVDIISIAKLKPEIIQSINKCDGLMLGSPTIVNDALPVI